MDQVLWVGKGMIQRPGLWEGGAAQALFNDTPEVFPASPPTCPSHPTFLPRSVAGTDLAVMEIAERSPLVNVGNVHQIQMCKGDNVDAESKIHFAISWRCPPGAGDHAVAPPTTLPQRGGCPRVRRLGHGLSHVHVIAGCACLCVCIAKLDKFT